MANVLFDAYKAEQLGDAAGPGHGFVDWEDAGADIKTVLIDESAAGAVDPTNMSTHADYADISAGIVTNGNYQHSTQTVALSSGTATVDLDDAAMTSVSGEACDLIIIYEDSGTPASSLLLVHFDSAGGVGLPVTPNGGDITVAWNASGVFTW
jgi:hypothetical protein